MIGLGFNQREGKKTRKETTKRERERKKIMKK